MEELHLNSDTFTNYAIVLSILTKRRVRIPTGKSYDDNPFTDIIKKITPSTSLSYEKGFLHVTPGSYTGGKFRATIDTKIERPDSIVEPLIILGFFGRHDLQLTLDGITNYGEPLDFVEKIHGTVVKFFTDSLPSVSVKKRGFSPQGKGTLIFTMPKGLVLRPVNLDKNELLEWIDVMVITARISSDFLKRVATGIKERLGELCRVKVAHFLHNSKDSGPSPGAECIVVAGGKGALFYSISNEHDTPENVADTCCAEILEGLEAGGNVDPKLVPFFLVLMALANGVSRLRCCQLTCEHAEMKEMLKVFFNIEISQVERNGENFLLVIGVGHRNPFVPI